MRKISLLFFSVLFISAAQAQITEGSLFLGGNFGGNSNTTSTLGREEKTNTLNFTPAFGIAGKNNTVRGIRLEYAHFGFENEASQVRNESNSYGAGIFLRKYQPLGKNFYVFAEGGLGYTYQKDKQVNSGGTPAGSRTTRRDNIALNLTPGIAYAVNRWLHLETGLSNLFNVYYSTGKTTDTYASPALIYKLSSFGASANLNNSSPFFLGFRFVIAK